MGPKKCGGAKALTLPPDKRPDDNHSDCSNMSTIDKASFLEGLEKTYGNILHSTALEDELNIIDERQVDGTNPGRKVNPPKNKTTAEQHGTALKRKQAEMHEESKENNCKRRRTTTVETSDEQAQTANGLKKLVGKKPKGSKESKTGHKIVERPVKIKQMKKQNEKKSDGTSGDSQSQEERISDTVQQRRSNVLSSEDELDEDTSWKPDPQKAKKSSSRRTIKSSSNGSNGKSSSGSASAEEEKPSSSKHTKKRRGPQGGTDSEVVLEAFLEFYNHYRESVESNVGKQSIDLFANHLKEQLLEKISSSKEFRVLKRENAKVGSLIRTKTQRLVDAKNELMRAERQVRLLQKEKAELEIRLTDLRRGHAFLRDIRELNRQYLDYRDEHPKEKEAYGAISLPALLLETMHMKKTDPLLKGIKKKQRINKTVSGFRK